MEATARRTGCPTDLELEGLWLREPGAVGRWGEHVSDCPDCAGRIAWMKEAEARFHAEVYPATVDAVVAAAPPARRRFALPRRTWLAALPATAALVLLLRAPVAPSPDYVGTKGADVALEIFARDGDGEVRRVVDGDRVPAGAGLRFVARAPGRNVLVLSVDRHGAVSRLFPAPGAPLASADGPLPGGALLDGEPGPERVFAVFLPAGARAEDVESAARAAFAGGGAGRVRAVTRLRTDAAQESILLEKVEGGR